MDAEAARFVVAGGDHAALVRPSPDRQRPAAQGRVIPHLDGGVEAVAVAVDDLAGGGVHTVIAYSIGGKRE